MYWVLKDMEDGHYLQGVGWGWHPSRHLAVRFFSASEARRVKQQQEYVNVKSIRVVRVRQKGDPK